MKKGFCVFLMFLILVTLTSFQLFGEGSQEDLDAGKKEKITYWTFLNPADNAPRSVAQNEIINNFNEKYPNIEVDVQVLGWSDIAPRLIRAVAAGNPPDVTRIASDSFEQQFGADTLQSLDKYVEQMKDSESFKNDFVLSYELGMDEGHKKAFWIDHRAVMLYFNKDHLKEIGLTEPPKSWQEVGEAAQKLANRGYIGMAIALGSGGAGNGFVEWFKPAIWSAGGDLLDDDGNAAFNSAAGVKAMELLYDFVYKYKSIPEEILTSDVDGMFQAFQAGRVSMMSFANHRFTTAQQTLGKDKVGIVPMPSFDGKEPAPAHITGWNLAIPVGAKNPDAAWKFIQHVISPESNVINSRVGGELATRISAFEDPWFNNDPVGKLMGEWKDYILNYGRMPQFPEDYLRLHDILVNAAQKIILNKQPIKQTLDSAALEYDEGR